VGFPFTILRTTVHTKHTRQLVLGGGGLVLGGGELALGGGELVLGGSELVLGGSELVLGGGELVLGGLELALGGRELALGGLELVLDGPELLILTESETLDRVVEVSDLFVLRLGLTTQLFILPLELSLDYLRALRLACSATGEGLKLRVGGLELGALFLRLLRLGLGDVQAQAQVIPVLDVRPEVAVDGKNFLALDVDPLQVVLDGADLEIRSDSP
jgi:hypothetical protein